jgi:hypothetical protein
MFFDSAGGIQRVGDWPTLRRRWTNVMEGRKNSAPIRPLLPSAFKKETLGKTEGGGRWRRVRARELERFFECRLQSRFDALDDLTGIRSGRFRFVFSRALSALQRRISS